MADLCRVALMLFLAEPSVLHLNRKTPCTAIKKPKKKKEKGRGRDLVRMFKSPQTDEFSSLFLHNIIKKRMMTEKENVEKKFPSSDAVTAFTDYRVSVGLCL